MHYWHVAPTATSFADLSDPSPLIPPPPLPCSAPCCCLQWSSQPIYVLDKDNDLTVSQLALRNAVDMVRVQPEGPYLVGGHSYGGAGG